MEMPLEKHVLREEKQKQKNIAAFSSPLVCLFANDFSSIFSSCCEESHFNGKVCINLKYYKILLRLHIQTVT